ncbi:hypothetical protein Tco_0026224 [Tanacetum coccineum]
MLVSRFVPALPTTYTFVGALPFPVGLPQLTPTVMGQMANSVVLVAFGSTLSIIVIVTFGAQRFRSSVRFLLTRPSSVSPASILPLVLLLLVLIVP